MAATRIQHRRGTAEAWLTANPVLEDGEIGIETDTGYIRIGNGDTPWADLAPSAQAVVSPTAAEWFTRNPVLGDGVVGVERDTKKIKVGDGATLWNNLAYTDASVFATKDYLTEKLSAVNVLSFGALGDGVTDDSPAIQNALAYARTVFKPVYFPNTGAPYQLVSSSLKLLGGDTLLGPSRGRRAALRSSTVNLIEMGTVTTGATYVTLQHLSMESAIGGGHIFFAQPGTSGSSSFLTIADFTMLQRNSSKSAIHSTIEINEGYIGRGHVTHTTDATVPTFYISNAVNAFNVNVIERLRMQNSGDYSIHIINGGGDYLQDLSIRDINFQQCLGGHVRLSSVRNAHLERLAAYDAPTPYIKDLYRFDKSAPGNPSSTTIICRGLVRRGGSLAANVYDIHSVAGESGAVTIDKCNGSINLGSNSGVVVLGLDPTTPAGSVINLSENRFSHIGGQTDSRRFGVVGTGGTGYIDMSAQSTTPAAGTVARLFLNSSGTASVIQPSGAQEILGSRKLTANRLSEYTVSLADLPIIGNVSRSTDVTVTVPLDTGNTAIDIPDGSRFELFQNNTGRIIVVAESGVSFRVPGGKNKSSERYATIFLTKLSPNVWTISGNIAV